MSFHIYMEWGDSPVCQLNLFDLIYLLYIFYIYDFKLINLVNNKNKPIIIINNRIKFMVLSSWLLVTLHADK